MRNFLIFAFLIELIVIGLTTPRLRVDTVQIDGATLRTPVQVAQIAGVNRPVNIFLAPVSDVRKKLAALPEVAQVQVERVFPKTLSIAIQERKPVASVASGEAFWVIDNSGTVFRKVLTPLPKLAVAQVPVSDKIVLGKPLPSPVLKPVLRCLLRARHMSLGDGARLTVDASGRMMILTPDGLKIRLGAVDRSPDRLAVLERLFKGKDGKRLRERALMIDVGTPRGEVWKPRPEWADARLTDIRTGQN